MADRIKNFRVDRISNIFSGETPVPMDDDPKIIFHVIPFEAFDPIKMLPISSLKEGERKISPIFFGISNTRYNLEGYLIYGGSASSSSGYLQLFRNGIIEVVGRAAAKDDKMIPAIEFENDLHSMLPEYISFQRDMGLSPPFVIALSLVGVRNCTLYVPRFRPQPDQKIDRDVLMLPDSLIEQFEFDLDGVIRQILDPLWNASGFEGSPHFDPTSGKWKEYPSR
jgi:hypothetical protein